jgi:hypothetical protein
MVGPLCGSAACGHPAQQGSNIDGEFSLDETGTVIRVHDPVLDFSFATDFLGGALVSPGNERVHLLGPAQHSCHCAAMPGTISVDIDEMIGHGVARAGE